MTDDSYSPTCWFSFLSVYCRNSGIKFFTEMFCKMETPKVNSVSRMKIKMIMTIRT